MCQLGVLPEDSCVPCVPFFVLLVVRLKHSKHAVLNFYF